MNFVHYEQHTIVSPAQRLSFILQRKSPDSEVPQDWYEQITAQVSRTWVSLWLSDSPVERQPPGHTKDFATNFLRLFCLFSFPDSE